MDWPLVGRTRELGLIRSLQQDPDCHGVVLAGPPGVGKSRLCREAIRPSRSDVTVGGWRAASRATQEIPLGAIAHLLPADGPPAPADRFSLLRWAHDAVAELTGTAGGVLAVDDAHLLDELSATVVSNLVNDDHMFLVLTVRDGEPRPDPLASLRNAGQVEWLDIGPLDRTAVEMLTEAVLAGPVEARTRHEFWRLSAGNPLFVRELLLGAKEARILTQQAGTWSHHGSLAGFARIQEVMETRLEHLTAPERDALEILAIAEPVGVALLEEASSPDVVESLEERHLLEVWTDRRRLRARTAHPLHAEAVAAGMPKLRKRGICRQLADLLENGRHRRHDDLLRLGTWRLESGAPSDPTVMERAARQAQRVFDHELAERLARAACEQGDSFEASVLVAESVVAQGRLDEAEQLTSELVDAADNDHQRTRAMLARANLLVFRRGDPQVLELLEQGAVDVSDPACRDELDAMLVFAASYLGELPRAIEGGRRFLGRDAPSPGALLRVLVVYTYARPLMAQYEGLDEEINRGLEVARANPDLFPLAAHLLKVNKGFALRSSGRLVEAEKLVREHYSKVVEADVQDVQGLWATQVANTLDVRGHARAACRYYDEALALLERHDPAGMHLLVMALASYAMSLIGNRARARELLTAYDEGSEGRAPAFGTVWEGRARTWLSYLDGDLPEAAAQAKLAGEIGIKEHLRFFAAITLHDAVRFGYPDQVIKSLQALQDTAQGELIPLLATHAQALADRDAARLDSLADGFETLGCDLYAAECAAQAAYIYGQDGRQGAHRQSRSRAAQLAGRCPGVSTPWLWLERPDQLTPRETEVAFMAARGHTNREISTRLGISIRTVGNHLASVYAKLGASGRQDLATFLDMESR